MNQQETVAQPVDHDNSLTAPVRRMPQYSAPSAESLNGGETRLDDDTKTEPDDDTKTEPDDGINENDVNADILFHAILNRPLPPSVVASIQVLNQRKRRNSDCREGISHVRARRRQMNTEEDQEDGSGTLRQRTRFNHSSRPSPYGSATWRRKGNIKGHEKRGDDPLGGTHSQASAHSSTNFQAPGVKSGNHVQRRPPFNPSILSRHSSELQGKATSPSQPSRGCSTTTSSSPRRLREDDFSADASEVRSKRDGPVKRARFRGSAEEAGQSAQPLPHPAQSIPHKRPPLLRRTFGFGSAGRGFHRPINNGGVQVRTDGAAATRRARYASSTPASGHPEAAWLNYIRFLSERGSELNLPTFPMPNF